MKRIILSVLVICVVLICASCGSDAVADDSSLETQYYDYAQECISAGDLEKAISVLEEGIAETDSQKLKELLDSISSTQSSTIEPTVSSVTESVDSSVESTQMQNSQTQSTDASSGTSSQEQIRPHITSLVGTKWFGVEDLYEDKDYTIRLMHFVSDDTVKFGTVYTEAPLNLDDEPSDIDWYEASEYNFDGKTLTVTGYCINGSYKYDTYKNEVIVLNMEDTSRFKSTADVIKIHGYSPVEGYWQFYGYK